MDEITIDPNAASIVADRRARRSGVTTEALAYQCAHVQEGLTLDAIIVADDSGDRWVGAGDRALCRFLARNAPSLAAGEKDTAMKLRALQTISEGLEAAHVTTARIKIPRENRYIFVTGVGANRMRTGGVAHTAGGTQRILGFRQPVANSPAEERDATHTLQTLVDGAYGRLIIDGGVTGPAPPSFMGFRDDRVYQNALGHILAPALETTARSGVIVDEMWQNYRFRSREVRHTDGLFERNFRLPMRESRSGVRIGELEVRFFHRHDAWDIPACPQLIVRWR